MYLNKIEQLLPRKFKRLANSLAVGLSLITGLLIVYALIIMIAPQLFNSIRSLWDTLPDKVNQFLSWARATFGENEELLHMFNTAYNTLYSELDSWADNTLMPYLTNIVSGVGSSVYKILMFLYNLLIGLIVACYLLASRKKFARQSVLIVRSILKPRWADLFLNEVAFVDRMFGGFIEASFWTQPLWVAVLPWVYHFQISKRIAGLRHRRHYQHHSFFGPFIGAVPSTLLIMIENPIKGLWFILFVLALQQLDGNIIGPKILGDRTGLSSFWVLFAIVLFGGLWGLVGMVVCVPVFAVLYDTVKKLVRRGLSRKGGIELWERYKADYPDEDPEK